MEHQGKCVDSDIDETEFRFTVNKVRVIGEKYSEKLLLTLDTSTGRKLSLRFGVDETNEIRAILCEDLAEQYGDAWD